MFAEVLSDGSPPSVALCSLMVGSVWVLLAAVFTADDLVGAVAEALASRGLLVMVFCSSSVGLFRILVAEVLAVGNLLLVVVVLPAGGLWSLVLALRRRSLL